MLARVLPPVCSPRFWEGFFFCFLFGLVAWLESFFVFGAVPLLALPGRLGPVYNPPCLVVTASFRPPWSAHSLPPLPRLAFRFRTFSERLFGCVVVRLCGCVVAWLRGRMVAWLCACACPFLFSLFVFSVRPGLWPWSVFLRCFPLGFARSSGSAPLRPQLRDNADRVMRLGLLLAERSLDSLLPAGSLHPSPSAPLWPTRRQPCRMAHLWPALQPPYPRPAACRPTRRPAVALRTGRARRHSSPSTSPKSRPVPVWAPATSVPGSLSRSPAPNAPRRATANRTARLRVAGSPHRSPPRSSPKPQPLLRRSSPRRHCLPLQPFR